MRNYLSIHIITITFFINIISCKKESPRKDDPIIPNNPPIANAGYDRFIVLPTDSVWLDGSASKDPGGSITKWQWTKISGPSSYSISIDTITKIKVKGLAEGVYEFELKVTNAKMLIARDTVQVKVAPDPIKVCESNRPEVNAQLLPFATLSKAGGGMFLVSVANKIFFGVATAAGPSIPTSTNVDIYDLSTQFWSTASLNSLYQDAAVAVNNNKIFFGGGGYIHGDEYYSTVQVYDILANSSTWSNLSVPKTGVAAASVGNKVLFAGGLKWGSDYSPNNVENLVEIYNVVSGTWTNATLTEPGAHFTAVTVGQKVYFAGGSSYINGASNKIEIYDNANSSWSTSTLNYLLTASGAISTGNKIFWKDYDCNVEIRDLSTGVSSLASLSRSGYTINVLKDDKVVFIRPGSKYFDIYNTTTDQWSVGVLPQPVLYGASAISVNNIIYIAGGTIDCTPIQYGCIPVYTNQVYKLEF